MRANLGIKAVKLDLSRIDEIQNFVEQSAIEIGGVTVLILNAAVTGIREDHDYSSKVVFEAQKRLVESASGFLRKTNGRIVFLTSGQAWNPVEGHEHYGKAKREVEDFLREFSRKPENENTSVFLVNPGHVDTRMHQEAMLYGKGAIRKISIKAKEDAFA